MVAVIADLSGGQRQGHALAKGRTHVQADVTHLSGVPAVDMKVDSEVDYGLAVPALGGEQQPPGRQAVPDGDLDLPTAQAGSVDADSLHDAHVVQRSRLLNVVRAAQSQLAKAILLLQSD